MKLTNLIVANVVEFFKGIFRVKDYKETMRVFLAQDALRRIKLREITPITGQFMCLSNPILFPSNEQLDKYFAMEDAKCSACALGSLMVPYIVKNDDTTKLDLTGDPDVTRNNIYARLTAYFLPRSLAMIECAFEGQDYKKLLTSQEYVACRAFRSRYERASLRLEEILLNITENGDFVLPKWALDANGEYDNRYDDEEIEEDEEDE